MRYAILACAMLAGCAGRPLTPEQRAAIMQYTLTQQQIQQQQANDAMNAYRGSIQAPAQPAQSTTATPLGQTITCTSTKTYGATTTTCR